MFDVDGTLIESCDFDSECYAAAVTDVLQVQVDSNWSRYTHVTDTGILRQIIQESETPEITDEIVSAVKQRFLHYLSKHFEKADVVQIPGAAEFIRYLKTRKDVAVSFATGGWLESAEAKLQRAEIDTAGLLISSSNDHYSRSEIMKLSELKHNQDSFESITYFGDAPWDREASLTLAYNFVLVGDRFNWKFSIKDYSDIPYIIQQIGL